MKKFWEEFQSHPMVVYIIGTLVLGSMFSAAYAAINVGADASPTIVFLLFMFASFLIRYLQYLKAGEFDLRAYENEIIKLSEIIKEWTKVSGHSSPSSAKKDFQRLAEVREGPDPELIAQIEKLRNRISELDDILKRRNSEIEGLKKSKPKKDQSRKDNYAEQQIRELKDEIRKLKEELEKAKAEALKSANSLDSSKRALELGASEIEELRAKLGESLEASEKLNADLQSKRNSRDLLANELDGLKSQNSKLKSEVTKLTSQRSEQVSRLISSNKKLEGLKRELEEKVSALEEAKKFSESTVSILRECLISMLNELDNLKRSLKERLDEETFAIVDSSVDRIFSQLGRVLDATGIEQ